MSRRVRCWMCGALTERARFIVTTLAIAPGVDAPGARPKEQPVCASCYAFLDDDDEDADRDDGFEVEEDDA